MEVLKRKGHPYLWFLTENLSGKFPFPQEPSTSDMRELINFRSDAVFCPGNEVPHYLRGLKVQIFHGLAGEKKGHFRIRHYFDLYLTQGPYFTEKFLQLKEKYRDFEVIETGWPKLDIYGRDIHKYDREKEQLLQKHGAKKLLLYAPTFSPSLTSAPELLEEIGKLAAHEDNLLLIKFHDLMDPKVREQYQDLAAAHQNLVVEEEPNIVKFLLMADLLISDTSSVVYEFLLLNKPVVTVKSNAENIRWDNALAPGEVSGKVADNLERDPFREQRQQIISEYHPYNDGRSAERMIEAVEAFIAENGVPERRKLPFLRRLKMNRMFGKF